MNKTSLSLLRESVGGTVSHLPQETVVMSPNHWVETGSERRSPETLGGRRALGQSDLNLIYRLLILAVYLAAGLVQNLAAAPPGDLIIVPGKRIGTVTSDASLADFTKAFGAVNVKQSNVYLGGENEELGLILFPQDPARRLNLGWKDPAVKRGVRQIFIVDESEFGRPRKGKWRLKNGLAIGTTLKEMEKLNGRPFTLYFTNYDAGCGIASWKSGRLTDGFSKNWKVLVEADRSWGLRITKMIEARNADYITFESNSADMQSSNPWVRSIYVYF